MTTPFPDGYTTVDVGAQPGYGTGFHKRFLMNALAPNQVWQTVVPGGEIWRITSFALAVTADSVAGNRVAQITMTDQDGNAYWVIQCTSSAAATQSFVFVLLDGFNASNDGANETFTLPAPRALLRGGDSLLVSVTGSDPGDFTQGPFLEVQVYRDGSDGYTTGRLPQTEAQERE